MIINILVTLIWNDKAKIVKPNFYKKLHNLSEGTAMVHRETEEEVITPLHTQEH